MNASLATFASVFKLRIGVAIALSALAGVAVTPGTAPAAWQVAVLAVTVIGASAAAGAFNHYVERDLDARMGRTRRRPFVTGVFKPGPAWLSAIALLLLASVGGAALALGPLAALHVLLGALVYGVVYTVWLKRRSVLNIVVGGLAGSFAVLAGAATVDPAPGTLPLLFAAIMFLWTPPHFWSLASAMADDYARAGVPMLPVVVGQPRAAEIILAHTVVLVSVSLLPAAFGLGAVYLVAAAAGGAYFLLMSLEFVRSPDRGSAMRAFHASLIQLACVLGGAMVDGVRLG